MSKLRGNPKQIRCQACNEPATIRCNTCKQYLCQRCEELHGHVTVTTTTKES